MVVYQLVCCMQLNEWVQVKHLEQFLHISNCISVSNHHYLHLGLKSIPITICNSTHIYMIIIMPEASSRLETHKVIAHWISTADSRLLLATEVRKITLFAFTIKRKIQSVLKCICACRGGKWSSRRKVSLWDLHNAVLLFQWVKNLIIESNDVSTVKLPTVRQRNISNTMIF